MVPGGRREEGERGGRGEGVSWGREGEGRRRKRFVLLLMFPPNL